jgi:hypothetical protein
MRGALQAVDNSPAIYGWGNHAPTIQSPDRDGRTFLSSRTGLATLPNRETSLEWLGYFQIGPVTVDDIQEDLLQDGENPF